MTGKMFGPINDRYLEYARIIGDSGSHLLTLINDITRDRPRRGALWPGPLHAEPVFIAEVVAFSVSMVDGMARNAAVACEVEVEPDIPVFHADGKKLQQILINLLSNAVKFTPAGGSVSAEGGPRAGRAELMFFDHRYRDRHSGRQDR